MSEFRDFLEEFANPPAEYGLQPFWFWNGDMEPDEMLRQLQLMWEAGVTGFVIHARKGLTIPYLSDTWFDRVELVLNRAKELGMIVWIYDEENWASGYAGGRVLKRDPSLTPQCLSCERIWLDEGQDLPCPSPKKDDSFGRGEVVAVNAMRVTKVSPHPRGPLEWRSPHLEVEHPWYQRGAHSITFAPEALSLPTDAPWKNPGGRWLVTVFRRETTKWFPAYSDEYYVDVLRKETAPIFIETTHEEYLRRFAHHFGDPIVGFFVDEPGLYNNFWDRNPASLAWTEDFAEAFLFYKGYDLRDCLIALYEQVGDTSDRIRFDYYDVVSRLMQERFMQPLADWCEAHGVQHTGHLMLEEFMVTMARYAGNPFVQLKTLSTPGVDRIDEAYEKVAERLVASVAHLSGRKRVLSETYALIGWKLAPPYMKQIFDYQAARGVNLLSPHAFYYSVEDYRKDESPPSEFFQNPWWPHFAPFARYVHRLCFALSQGKPVKDFLLYYPIETVYSRISPDDPPGAGAGATEHWQIGSRHHPAVKADIELTKAVAALEENGHEFDLIDYTFLRTAQVAQSAERTCLKVGDLEVPCIVLPHAELVDDEAAAVLERFVSAGGIVLSLGAAPKSYSDDSVKVSGRASGVLELEALLVEYGITQERSNDYRLQRRTPSSDNPARPVRHVNGPGFVRCERQLPSGDRLVFEAPNPLWDEFSTAAVQREGIGLDPASGAIVPAKAPGLRYVPKEPFETEFPQWRECLNIQPRLAVQFGSEAPIELETPKPWHALGKALYSGTARYEATVELPELKRLIIYAELRETARLWINGIDAGPRCFPPFEWDVTEWVRKGANELTIEVANTMTGQFERVERLSGLLKLNLVGYEFLRH